MERNDERRYRGLSPFELKNTLIELARHRGERMMLNAGRGNPNWVVLAPRAATALLGQFAHAEATRVGHGSGLGGLPRKAGIARRLESFLETRAEDEGVRLLRRGVGHAAGEFGMVPDLLVGEWVDGVLGDHYPVPMRMLAHAEGIIRRHLAAEVFGGDPAAEQFDLFAVEGASAGIAYLFQSLVASGLLAVGDRIALGTPIFTPYLDVPRLPEYGFELVEVKQDEVAGWRYPQAELDKLRDPRVKLFLVVNPSNPTATALDSAALAQIAAIATARPDLLIVTDDVYASFVEGFRSLAAVAPRNTVLIYSFSKFWGATGARLGVVGLHRSNAADAGLGAPAAQARACLRYAAVATEPGAMKFIDRMVADSRAVGLNHTAGLSTPQQVLMTLCALDGLLDDGGERRRQVRALVSRRYEALYRGAGLPLPPVAGCSRYYVTLDIPALAAARYGAGFADWLTTAFEPIDFVVRLAELHGIVLLDGGGFDAPRMSVRVSLANLPDDAYEVIGRAIASLLEDEYWRKGYLARR